MKPIGAVAKIIEILFKASWCLRSTIDVAGPPSSSAFHSNGSFAESTYWEETNVLP